MRWIVGDRATPDVIVDFVFDRGLLSISLRNIGDAPAYRVSVVFDREVRGVEGTKVISAMPLFSRLEFLPPQKELVTFVDTAASYFRRKQPSQIETRVVFHDRRGRRYTNNIRHNLDIYRDIGYVS